MQNEQFASSAALRETMVERQIRTFDVTDLGVQAQMKDVPREIFVDPAFAGLAYSDARLTLSGKSRREMTAPLVLARLLKEARLRENDRVLVVAGATGYAAALVAGLAGSVVSLDDDETFAARAQANFAALGLTNAKSLAGPLDAGASADAPFDAIIVDGVSQGAFGGLFGQLAEGGRLIGIVSAQAGAQFGKAILYLRVAGQASPRPLFDASAGALAAFAKPVEFVF
ncbi:protein-L-isoaspartate O-methyltransferase [Rhodoblastus acidophilus]|uniref:Protein-L-isoaspartate O-methyltransferase n=1 Tax=Candidatus Rhodoblastus alkanivorans TaxID=2954117 RepID=A0ABS9Z8A4_9HYPH|nr:protein-L-isoaspartate O-methyltransferase [Candidatus Rhodoblastus alkanivorans]MCI4677937.1 protein-L-isoaspartate O-methyltransferase [Candidatus Rhodoblastus alkanivorans]MCI4683832.1 protein-L-isoaspartate O-methyltransferase [Candidatus Rhodoblastus alkanivorans]MDI4641150.1 protein-L-isoaspartate O-methyltransferase [Rhodoblastus acidophilus]